MDRINHASAEQDKFGAGKDGWTNGDPADPGSGTVPQEEWFDGVQEELIGLIERAGLTPSNADYTQLQDVLMTLVTTHYQAEAGIDFDTMADTDARIQDTNNPTGDRYLVARFGSGASNFRVYYDGVALEFAHNASWSQGTGWVSSGSNEGMISINPGSATTDFYSVLSSNVFTRRFTVDGNPNTIPTTPGTNTLYPVGITRMMGKITTQGNGVGTGSTYVQAAAGALNIDTTDLEVTTSEIDVHFTTPFANSAYIIQVTGADVASDRFFAAAPFSGDYAQVRCYDLSTGLIINPASTPCSFYIEAKGGQ